MERLKRGREGGWEVTIFGGLSGRDGGEGGYRCKPGRFAFWEGIF